MQEKLKKVGNNFNLLGDFMYGEPYGTGHINDTYCVAYSQANKVVKYIHQRINDNVFTKPVQVMDNIKKVTEHQLNKLIDAGQIEASRACLQLVDSGKKHYYKDNEKKIWRTYLFIENAHTYDIIETEDQAFEAAAAFAKFQETLSDLTGEKLHETIPDFHNTVKRLKALKMAIEENKCLRAASCIKEIEFALERENISNVIVDLLKNGGLPERITHNDTKLNNVMIDDLTHKSVCVIDLDTVMPGSVLYDFGDLVRTSTSPALEDETDLNKVYLQENMFEALVKGYLSKASKFLTEKEIELLQFSGKLIAFETGIRFLTDYLNGDTYFKTSRERHNLDRCRTQFKLIESMERQETRLQEIVDQALSEL